MGLTDGFRLYPFLPGSWALRASALREANEAYSQLYLQLPLELLDPEPQGSMRRAETSKFCSEHCPVVEGDSLSQGRMRSTVGVGVVPLQEELSCFFRVVSGYSFTWGTPNPTQPYLKVPPEPASKPSTPQHAPL